MKGVVGFSTSLRYVEHETGPHHPERPDRIRTIARAVRAAGLVASADPFPDFQIELGLKDLGREKLVAIEPRKAEMEELEWVHSKKYVDRIREICASGGGVLDQGDTPVGRGSYETALLSVGGVLACCDAVMKGEVLRAFSAGRPPGHHAEPDRPMGFCLFSNVAIAAKYLQKKHGVGRVAIVDFDVHHGNGTQAAFEDDASVLFVSIHQHPRTCYPGSGYDYEMGDSAGRGYTLNLPVAPGSGDEVYLGLMEKRVLLKVAEFRPEMLLVSAGFDAHAEDPLAQMEVSEEGFEKMTRMLVGAAEEHCQGRVVSALEGGYQLRALGRSVVRHLVGLGA